MQLHNRDSKMKFHIIFRFTDDGIAARSSEFPDLSATGRTVAEAEVKMGDAIREHVEELQTQGRRNEPLAPQSLDGPL